MNFFFVPIKGDLIFFDVGKYSFKFQSLEKYSKSFLIVLNNDLWSFQYLEQYTTALGNRVDLNLLYNVLMY